MAYRVEIVVCCPRGHKLLPFHRITVPELDDGVAYEANKRGRFARLSGTDYRGREWHRIHLRCYTPLPTGQRCQAHVEINRDRVERKLADMWAPMARRKERVVWDEQSTRPVVCPGQLQWPVRHAFRTLAGLPQREGIA